MNTPFVHRFWPVVESAQADYEALREQVIAEGRLPDSLTAARFLRRGLAGLIAWPTADPVYRAALHGAARPRWTPRQDPRLSALAAGYGLLLSRSAQAIELDTGQG